MNIERNRTFCCRNGEWDSVAVPESLVGKLIVGPPPWRGRSAQLGDAIYGISTPQSSMFHLFSSCSAIRVYTC
ncbi:MAG: hypothetical protein AAFP00_09285 [Bacteroidota bacterium]